MPGTTGSRAHRSHRIGAEGRGRACPQCHRGVRHLHRRTRRAHKNASDAGLMAVVRVNGEDRQVDADDDTALLYILRNHLGLKGTRFGCGLSVCGACSVLVDGRPAYSCDTPLWSVKGKDVTTVEGLGTDVEPHPVARAIVEQQAAQCGYCMSGIVVSAAALLATNADPSESEVRAALDDNLCRCGAHNRVVRAVLTAAAEMRLAAS